MLIANFSRVCFSNNQQVFVYYYCWSFKKQLQEISIKLCSKPHKPLFSHPKVSSSEQQGVPLDTLFHFYLINNISCTLFPWKPSTIEHI